MTFTFTSRILAGTKGYAGKKIRFGCLKDHYKPEWLLFLCIPVHKVCLNANYLFFFVCPDPQPNFPNEQRIKGDEEKEKVTRMGIFAENYCGIVGSGLYKGLRILLRSLALFVCSFWWRFCGLSFAGVSSKKFKVDLTLLGKKTAFMMNFSGNVLQKKSSARRREKTCHRIIKTTPVLKCHKAG